MPTPKKGARLGGSPAHQRLMVANLATSLFEHGRITTTEAKARVLRPVAEKLITKAKKADLGTPASVHQRRQVLRTIRDKEVVHALFTEIAPRFAERPGGYTRITKIGPRKGDNAPMAVIELVTEEFASTGRASTAPATQAVPVATEQSEQPAAETEPVEAEATEVEEADDETSEPYPGSHAPSEEDPSVAPEGFEIKGNEDSKKYHEPDGQWYEQTQAEVWFDSPESAEAAGFTRAGGDD